jgi:hypothetical protein
LKLLFVFLIAALLAASADAQLERGVKGNMEDVVLVGADDWHGPISATPLAIWSDDRGSITKPLIILPKAVSSGTRLGWVEQKDLDRYGVVPVLQTLESGNITAIIIHGSGELVKGLVEGAHKDGLKAYVTATLELPSIEETTIDDIRLLTKASNVTSAAQSAFLSELDLTSPIQNNTDVDQQRLQRLSDQKNGSFFCPVNPEAREELYNLVERLIEDYKADGVVLYNIGFQDENYCFCDFCKQMFYKDTGIDLTKVYSSSYNLERWKQWKQAQVLEIVRDVRNITTELGPAKLGVAIGNPFDRSQGYNYADISKLADFTVISPVSPSDTTLATGMTSNPVFVRLSDDYVGYTLSTQNVEGAVKYIEDVVFAGADGFAYEYNVVYTPLWSELEPPSRSAKWLLKQLGGKTLGLGNVSWTCDSNLKANNSYDLAEKISQRWKSSPGAVIVGNNYSSGLKAATLASYLNWPVLFTGDALPSETSSALTRLGAMKVIVEGQISTTSRANLSLMNLSIIDDNGDLLQSEMKARGFSPKSIVMTNSHDLSLLPPVPKEEFKRAKIGDILVDVDINPAQIPAESAGEIVRLNITLTNSNSEDLKNVQLVDQFSSGKLIQWPKATKGTVKVNDPYTGEDSQPLNAFLDGSLLLWNIDQLEADKSASLTLEVEVLYPMDAGWKQRLDSGITITHSGLKVNATAEEKNDWPITNITYPSSMIMGIANISWNVERSTSFTTLNIYTPMGRKGTKVITDTEPGKRYAVVLPLLEAGIWKFNIEAGDGYTHQTDNYSIEVRSNIPNLNLSAFSHTKVPRLSLVAAQAAAARQGILVDVAKDPQEIDPSKEEKLLKHLVEKMKISPQYLTVVGDPGSLPFISTGMKDNISDLMKYDIYRDYQLNLDDENYSEVAVGRIVALSVYDASQLLARTMAYDQLNGDWKNKALVISSPPLDFPNSPTGISIRDYLRDAGSNVKDLRWEEATYQEATSQMNNGQNIVDFEHHGAENAWQLSFWSMLDDTLNEAQVKQLTLAPQTTTTGSCVTARLKGFYINISGTEMYVPMRLDDSMALAFIRAGAVNYIGPTSSSWIFISEDHSKRFYQALVYENATVGQAEVKADNLYRLKVDGVAGTKNIKDYDEILPDWDTSMQGMLNETASMNAIIGDPAFRPALPKTPALPYVAQSKEANQSKDNRSSVQVSYKPISDEATNWIYWIQTETTDGILQLNAPPALIGEVLLPLDAEEVLVKENSQAVWHDEELMGQKKRVMWPIIRPRLNETRTFSVEYRVVPGQIQVINITPGWNAVSIHLKPKETSLMKYLEDKPYRSVFSPSGEGWTFNIRDSNSKNLSVLEPGRGYLIDSSENFTIEVRGKAVDLPYRITLGKGWNLIGVPFNRTFNVNNVTVNAEHKRHTYSDAVEKGLISAFLWSYDGIEWNYVDKNDTLVPGNAYLLEASSECRLEFREG